MTGPLLSAGARGEGEAPTAPAATRFLTLQHRDRAAAELQAFDLITAGASDGYISGQTRLSPGDVRRLRDIDAGLDDGEGGDGGDEPPALPRSRPVPSAPRPLQQVGRADQLIARGKAGPATCRKMAERVDGILAKLDAALQQAAAKDRERAEQAAAKDRERAEQAAAKDRVQAALDEAARATEAAYALGIRLPNRGWRPPSDAQRTAGRAAAARAAAAAQNYDTRTVRAWAVAHGIDCPTRGRYLPTRIVDQWRAATRESA